MTSPFALPPHDLTALILAGGAGSRLGGQDKGLVPLAGKPLIEHVLPRLQPHVAHVLISANRNQQTYRDYATAVLPDAPDLPEEGGPFVGIATGLRAAPTPWVVVAPCDTPALPLDFVVRLAGALRREAGPLVAVAVTEGQRHPICMLLHRALSADLDAALLQGERQVKRWQDKVGALEVGFDDPAAFENLNQSEDFVRFEQRARSN